MTIRVDRRFHSPALWIIAAVVLLTVLQGYYAYSNHRRQQDLMADLLVRQEQGLTAEHIAQAQQEDLRRAIGTSVVILLLGGAAFYFLFVTQNAYATNRALSEARSYAQNVVDSISNGVFSVDRQGRVVSINDVACKILEVAPEEVVGTYYRGLISEGNCRLEMRRSG